MNRLLHDDDIVLTFDATQEARHAKTLWEVLAHVPALIEAVVVGLDVVPDGENAAAVAWGKGGSHAGSSFNVA